jgi:hypothetical protein
LITCGWRRRLRFVGHALGAVPCKSDVCFAHALHQHPIVDGGIPHPHQSHRGRLNPHQIPNRRLPCVGVAVPQTDVIHHVGGLIDHEIVLDCHTDHHSKITTPAPPAAPAVPEPLAFTAPLPPPP